MAIKSHGQEPHQKKALEIEELLEKNNPNQYKTISRKSNFLVYDNLKNGHRVRYFEGDMFRFRSKEGRLFQEELSEISDSTFTVLHYNNVERKLETWTFKLSDIKKIYKREVYKGIRWGLGWGSLSALLPLAYDWIYFKKPPLQNTQALILIPAIQAGNVVLKNSSKLFNGRKLTENKVLKIFRSI